jgi:hypothetical protein
MEISGLGIFLKGLRKTTKKSVGRSVRTACVGRYLGPGIPYKKLKYSSFFFGFNFVSLLKYVVSIIVGLSLYSFFVSLIQCAVFSTFFNSFLYVVTSCYFGAVWLYGCTRSDIKRLSVL